MNAAEELAAYRAKFGPLNPPASDPSDSTTHVLMVVDMSGSMASLAQDVRGGFNTYVRDLAGQPGSYRLTATLFDTAFIPLCVDAELGDVPEMTAANYNPRGMTALLDAVGKTVTEFEARATLTDEDKVLVVIQTDGEENSSKEWRWAAVQQLIKDREATGRWSFVYLGAGSDTWDQADRMGVARANYVNTAATAAGTASTYSGLTRGTVTFGATGDGSAVSRSVIAEPGATN